MFDIFNFVDESDTSRYEFQDFGKWRLSETGEYLKLIKICNELIGRSKEPVETDYFMQYDVRGIFLPSKFLPDPDLLKKHNDERFRN